MPVAVQDLTLTESATPSDSHFTPVMESKPSTETLIYCRLVAQLDKESLPENLKLFVAGQQRGFKVVLQVDLGQNRKCFGCIPDGTEDLVVAFSWFNPRNVVDLATLGMKMTKQRIQGNRNSTFSALAEEYYSAPGFAECVSKHSKVILTGFSMGGATANMMAFHMIEERDFKGNVTVVGLGCPRVGNAEFTLWFRKRLNPRSRNIIAAVPAEDGDGTCPLVFDPACVGPKLADGFEPHPNLRVLYNGRVHEPSEAELGWMEAAEASSSQSVTMSTLGRLFKLMDAPPLQSRFQTAWDRTHSVLKYYEFLTSAC